MREPSRSSAVPRLHAAKPIEIENADLFAIRIDQSVEPELREHAAYSFQLHPEIAADLVACHS